MEFGQINFGAFPRSGNHTLGVTLSLGFPDKSVNWLRHRITELSSAPNCAVVVRDPLNSISSWIRCNNDTRVDASERLVDWYVRYMRGILNAKNNLVILELETLSNRPKDCLLFFAERFGLDKPKRVSRRKVDAWMSENKPEHFPNEMSIKRNEWFYDVRNSSQYSLAEDLYWDVCSIAKMKLSSH